MSAERNIYLQMQTLPEAQAVLQKHFPAHSLLKAGSEMSAAPDAVGRVLAAPVFAQLSSPGFHAAAMDGIAVKAENTYGASDYQPRRLTVGRDALYVNTGHVLPAGTNAVIMIEQVHSLYPDTLEIRAPAFPWQYVRKMGEDIVATELLFPQNHRITPYCVGALIAGGVFSVAVRPRPRVLIIPTGSELINWQGLARAEVAPGAVLAWVLDSNSYVLGALVAAAGGAYEISDIIPDDPMRLEQHVQAAVRADWDMVLLIGGSSAGSADFSRQVISNLGQVLVHGVTIMPGKPLVAGQIESKPVFGMPGYPVSAIVTFEQFVAPLLADMLGQTPSERPVTDVFPTRNIPSKLGLEEFVRVKLGRVGSRIMATPLPRGAGNITSLTQADGIVRIPAHLEGLKANEAVSASLLRSPAAIANTIVVVGSHDNTLDLLADQLRAQHPGLSLSSSHVGSMGGISAIKRGGCHLAGAHLLDTADGSYNRSYIRRYLPNHPVRRVHLVMRDQGLIVLPGNPKKIQGVEDLVRPDITFVNRQGGSGTRILLDYRLQQLSLDPARINGYSHEEFTHMQVAADVASGAADAGLGIHAAARALGLDFVPVVTEQYDLLIPEMFFETQNIQKLLAIINSPVFKQRVEALGGYSTQRTGEIFDDR